MAKPSRKKRKASKEIAAAETGAGVSKNTDEGRPSQEKLSGRARYHKYYLAGSVSLITFAVYLTSLRNGFVNWDDGEYVVANPYIRSLNLPFLKWAFFDFHAGNWHPLTWISHALDYAIWGLNPLGHHLTNNLLHAINTFIVVVVAARLVDVWKEATIKDGISGFLSDRTVLVAGVITGLLFGLHPLHVESVAWVSERKDLLCSMFFLLGISAYTKYAADSDRNRARKTLSSFVINKYYLFTVGSFILALLSKPMAVTLPLVLLILDWYPFRRLRSLKTLGIVIVEKVPFFALSLVSSILTILAQRSSSSIGDAPLSVRIVVAFNSIITYLWKTALPVNLIPVYPFPQRGSFSFSDYSWAVVLVLGISATSLAVVRKRKIWLAAWCYYIATLLPVLGLVQVGLQSRADRYMYLPSLGPFLLIGLGAAWAYEKANTLTQRRLAVGAGGIAAAMFVSMSYLTVEQIGIWKDGFALWNYEIEKEPEKVPLAYMNRGMILSQKEDQLDKALSDFDEAIALNPSYHGAYGQRAIVYEKKGQIDKAIADFEKAITLNPSDVETHIRLGVLYGKRGSLDKAIEQLNEAVTLNPEYPITYDNRGFAYFLDRQYNNALRDFNKAIDLNQTYTNAYLNRGNLYLRTGNNRLAMSDFQKACDLKNEAGCNALRTLRKAAAEQAGK